MDRYTKQFLDQVLFKAAKTGQLKISQNKVVIPEICMLKWIKEKKNQKEKKKIVK